MISENKWKENMEKENLNKNNKDYIKDNTLSNDSNPLLMLLSASAILAGGALAYKRGFFKKPIQNTIKYASQFGKSDLNISSSIKAFNKWANIDNAESMYKNSIFRRDWSFEGVKDLVRDGNIKEAINDTKRDISNLIDKRTIYVNNFKKGKESNNRFYYQSELISELLDINRISNQYKKYPNGGALASKSKELMAKDLAQRLGVSKEVANGQLKRLGYRNLTLGDIYSTVVDKKTGKTKLLNINADFKFDEDSTRVIEEFLNVTTTIDKADNKSRLRYLIKTDKWKDFKVDSGLLINNAGEVADIRYAGRNTKEFIRTLANDYQIPMLNFNPLRFFGADKVGYKKNNYGIIHQSTIQSVLTGVPGRKTINQTKQFGNNPLLFVNGKVLRLEGEKAVRVKEVANNMKVDRMPKTTSSYGIRSDFNSLRKISGLNTKEYTLYGDEDGSVKSFFSKVMKKLDLGFQDRDASNTYSKIVKTKSGDKEVIVNTASSGLFDINGLIENTRNSILNKLPKPYKDTRESIRINQVFGTVRKDEDIYILRHKDTTLKDVITDKRADTLSRYYRETFAGRDNIKEVGDRALHTYSVVDRLNQTLSNIGLGLGMDSIGSSKEILTNLTLKRFLVVYGFYQTMQYVTMLTERGKEGREENKNIQTDVAEAFKVMDLSYHKLKDYTPITTVAKTLTDLLPGIDQVTELPGVSSLALDQTYEERKEYYESGMTPIRKGRYWELGNTPFTGCLTPFSNIYTSNGYKKACNINIGDYVLSKSGSYHKIIATKVREADETVYKVTTKLDKCEQTSLTGNHNVLAMKLSKCKRVSNSYCKPNKCLKQCSDCKHLFYEGYKEEWIPISNIVKNEYMLMYPIPKATNDDSFIKVSTILDDKKNKVTDDGKVFRKLKQNGTLFDDSMVNELIEISKINHKYGELKPKLDEISKKYCVTVKQLRQKLDDIRKNSNDYFRGYKYILSINPHIEINYELGKIIGYYASEGGYNARNITFTFNKNEVEYKNDVIHLLNSVFGFEIEKIKVKETKNAIVITINSLIAKEIFNFFAPGKAINKDKRLSKFTMNINNREFMLGFLETFIKGDGYQRKNGSPRISIVLSCYELTKNIQHMLLRLKILSTINKKKTSKINGKVYESYGLNINGIDCYNLQKLINNKVNTNDTKIKFTHSKIGWFTDDYAVVAIQDIAARHYIGQVYDFEVEQEESFVTNGYIMHNSKIQYYKPNLYRRIKGDVMFSDSKYGSREEYFDNAWFASPIKHFVTDKYHYDIKHYEDRPYLVTGEEFKNVPIIGDTLASTVGNFIKPQRKMHSEYWNATNSYQDEGLKMIVDDNMQDKATVNLINGYKGVDDKMLGQQIIFFNNDDKKSDTMLDNRVVVSNFNTVNSNPNDYVSIDFMPKEKPIPVVYKTSAGINGLYQASSTQDLINLRKNINTITPDKATGVNRLSLTDEEKELNIDTSYLPNDIKTTLAAQYTNLTNLTGMTGYITETLTGTPMDNANILDTSNYAYSFNKVFWDQEFGGMGGALSEIYRRFAPEKNKDFNYINPIRNTMACLLPDTDVLLYNGTNKKADKIKVGDILMSNNGEATVVEKVKTYDANEIINIVLYGDNYHVNRFSWNHPIYMDNRKFKNAIDVRKGEYIAFPINKYLQNDDIMIDLSSYLVDEYDDITITTKYIYYGIHSKVAVEREIAEEYNFDIKTIPPHLKKRYKKLYNICRYQTKLKNNKPDSLKRIPRFISQNDFYYILGVYGAEGSENNKGISLKFSGHVEDKWEDELCKIFDKYNVKYSKIKSKKGIGQSIVTNCVPLNRILTNVCQGHSRTKKYLPCIYNDYAKVCESSIKKLIKGYIDGDGYSMKTSDNRVKVGLTTTSYNMAYQIRNMIINTINIVPNFSHSKSKFGDEFRLISSGILANKLADELGIEYNRFEYNPKQNNQKQYTDGEYVYIKVKDVFVENKKCSVIGYTVDGNHTFCTANIATHNTWIPGDTYFTDFTKGDPYTKVKWGEGRLPGEGYERLWGIKPLDMGIGSSFIGKSKEDIIKHLLYQDEITDEGLKEILDKGTSMHNEIEKKMEASGDAEQTEKTIYDKKHNVQGTYDVMLSKGNQYTGKKGIMDIKTVGDKKFKEIEATGEAKIENVSQVNFYLHNLNMNNGSILYVNRDNPEEQRVIKFKYSKELYESDMQKLEEARSDIMAGIDSGEIKRGDLYSPIDRVRILADVAPYSKEYQEAVRLLKNKGMTEEKEAELKAIEERVKKQKQPLRVYDYKFSTANLDERVVKVDKVLGKGLFTVKGEDGVSYKLGGIDYAKLEGVEQERALESILNEHISEGQKLTIKVDPDELKSKPSGINSTIKAIVVSRGTNLNKELVEKGFATTKDDNSPISVNVKYSGFSKTFGKVWEKFAHMDTYFNTKFLQVRSPLEHYKRNVVYGEDFQEWERPIENFLMPVINKTIERPAGLLLAGFIGAAFGRTKSAKLIGAAIGVGTIATGKVIAQTKETITGEKWKPSNRKHEEDVEEYLDKLTYVKNMKLFEEYSNKALQEDGFDVKEYQRNNEIAANSRKAKASKVERKKKELNYGEITEEQYLNSFESSRLTDEQEAELKQKRKEMNKEIKKNSRDKIIDTLFSKKTVGEKFKKFIDIRKDRTEKYKETDEYIDKSTVTQRKRNINKDNNENTQFRKITQLPENAIMALQYYQKAQETVYGYDYGENVQNLMKALPKTEKDFFKYFVKAPEEEREEILQVIPNYLKEPMTNLWGKHTDTPKESLEDYFSEHQLPDEEWVGWDEDVDLNSLKVKLVNEEGLEATNFNIWQDDIDMANSVNIPIPHMNKKFNRNKAKITLERLLTESGYENVEVTPKSSLNNNIVLNIDNDTRYEVEQKLNEDYLF